MVADAPTLWCILGELTQDANHLKTAVELSGGRCARAMRVLGRQAFDRGDLDEAVKQLSEAVRINPSYHLSWFTLGCAAMRSRRWRLGIKAFSRVVQADPSSSDGWANLGSIYMTLRMPGRALNALKEAVKHKRRCTQPGAGRQPTLDPLLPGRPRPAPLLR